MWFKNDIKTLKKINLSDKKIEKIKIIFENFITQNKNFSPSFLYYDFHPQNFTATFKNPDFKITTFWDFENAFIGDCEWDIAYSIKLSFLRSKKLIKNFLNGYFNYKISEINLKKIKIYLLLIITGSITYALKNKKNYKKEIFNLNWYLKNMESLFNHN